MLKLLIMSFLNAFGSAFGQCPQNTSFRSTMPKETLEAWQDFQLRLAVRGSYYLSYTATSKISIYGPMGL